MSTEPALLDNLVEYQNRYCENEEFLERVFEKTQEAVLRSLGCFYAGNGGSASNKIGMDAAYKREEGVANIEVLGLIDSWNG